MSHSEYRYELIYDASAEAASPKENTGWIAKDSVLFIRLFFTFRSLMGNIVTNLGAKRQGDQLAVSHARRGHRWEVSQ